MTEAVMTRPEGRQANVTRQRPWLVPALPFLAVAGPFVLGAWRLIAHLATPFWTTGDLATLELGVRNALRGDQLLGAYSRFGWDQLGPAWFYLVAPVYRLGGSDPRSLFLATWLLNGLAAVGVVAVARRRGGAAAAWWAVAGVLAWLWWMTPQVVLSPWNPLTLALPLLLTLMLAAAALAGSGWSLVGAVACGSAAVQIHLGSTPVVAAALALGTAGWLIDRRRRRAFLRSFSASEPREERRNGTGRRRRVAMGLAVAAGVAGLWVPTLVEHFTGHPGNLVLTTRFFREGPPADMADHHSLGDAATAFSRQASAVPLGSDDDGRSGASTGSRQVVSLVWLALGCACALIGRRQRHRFAAACGTVAVLAGVVGALSATRVAGELFPYLFFFATVLPIPVVIGLGALAGRRRAAGVALVVAGGALFLATGWSALRAPIDPERSSPEVAAAAEISDAALSAAGHRQVMVRRTRQDLWPAAMGLAAALERDGYRVTVERNLVGLLGDSWKPSGTEQAEVVVSLEADPLPPPTGRRFGPEQHLGQAGGLGVWLRAATGG